MNRCEEKITIGGENYVVIDVLWRGDQTDVFLCSHNSKNYAVKRRFLSSSDRADGQSELDFCSLLSAAIPRCEHIVSCHFSEIVFSEGCGSLFLVQELGARNTMQILQDRMAARMRFSDREIVHVLCSLLDAVGFLHAQKPPIVHLDIKPENILLFSQSSNFRFSPILTPTLTLTNFVLKLCDFGSAVAVNNHIFEGGSMSPHRLSKKTTPGYCAPDILQSKSNTTINESADIWAVGVTMYVLCFFEHPFPEDSTFAVVNSRVNIPPSGFSPQKGSFGSDSLAFDAICDVIRLCLIRCPSERPSVFDLISHIRTNETIGDMYSGSTFPFSSLTMKGTMSQKQELYLFE